MAPKKPVVAKKASSKVNTSPKKETAPKGPKPKSEVKQVTASKQQPSAKAADDSYAKVPLRKKPAKVVAKVEPKLVSEPASQPRLDSLGRKVVTMAELKAMHVAKPVHPLAKFFKQP